MKQFIRLFAACLFSFLFFSCRKDKVRKEGEPGISLVPLEFARSVAQKFNPRIFLNSNDVARAAFDTNGISSYYIIRAADGSPAIYVFNFKDQKGFVFISADFKLRPVLAYIDKGAFQTGSKPGGFNDWLNRTKENLSIVRAGLYNNTIQGHAAWHAYVQQYNLYVPDSLVKLVAPPPTDIGGGTGGCEYQDGSSSVTVGPLLPVTWGQLCTYNDLVAPGATFSCIDCETRKPPTGCVATAMAQIIRYYQYPTNYDYASMPADHGNGAVQMLMRDAGINVGMQYDCTGSGAYGYNVPYGFKTGFGYSSANWLPYFDGKSHLRIQDNLNHGWPVMLQGKDATAGSHEWVCDGYQQTTVTSCHNSTGYLTFHMNWGWHEVHPGPDYSGWYAFDNWYIYGLEWNFCYAKYYVSDIHP